MQRNTGPRGRLTLLWANILSHRGVSSFRLDSTINQLPCCVCIQNLPGLWRSSSRPFCVLSWRGIDFIPGEIDFTPGCAAVGNFDIHGKAGRKLRFMKDVALGARNHDQNSTSELLRQTGIKVETKFTPVAPLAQSKILPKQNLNFRRGNLEPHNRNEKVRFNGGRTKLAREHVSESRSTGDHGSALPSDRIGNAARTQPPAVESYIRNRQLSFLAQTGHLGEFLCTFEQLLDSGCRPDSYTLLYVIRGFCEAGEVAKALDLFRKRFPRGSRFNGAESFLCNVMIDGLAKAGHIADVMNLAQNMTEQGWLPDIYTYNSIICSLGKIGRVDDALAFLVTMSSSGCVPDLFSYNSLISALGNAGRYTEAYALYDRMVESGCLPDSVTFNILLAVLCKAGKVSIVDDLFKFMKRVGWEPDVYTYTSLSVSLCRSGRVDEALQLSVEMTERGCAPNTATFNSWLDGLCKDDRVAEAHLLWQEMIRLGYLPDNITYSILIHASCKTRKFVDQSFTLLKHLIKSTDSLDSRTSDIVFKSFEKVGMLKQARRIARNARAKKCRSS